MSESDVDLLKYLGYIAEGEQMGRLATLASIKEDLGTLATVNRLRVLGYVEFPDGAPSDDDDYRRVKTRLSSRGRDALAMLSAKAG